MTDADPRYHAHIYFSVDERPAAEALRAFLLEHRGGTAEPRILFVGPLRDMPVGPHPIPQFETHFLESSRDAAIAAIEPTGLRALVHPLTDDDLADHTSLAHWLGEPLALDLSVLDPPGVNQGVPRFGKTDF
jgi:DOPA 4,5-dioxygenase